MSRDPARRGDESMMERYLPIHWRFQQLLGVPEDRSAGGLYSWCLAVEQAIREVLGPSNEWSLEMEYIRGLLRRAEFIRGWKRDQKIREAVWTCASKTRGMLLAAALEESVDKEAVRILDMHPWVAEPAASRFPADPHAAVLLAAANIEAMWRTRLDGGGGYKKLAESFKPDRDPERGIPVLRFTTVTEGTDDWTNAHEGAFFYATGCLKRIRNMLAHHAHVDLAPGYALEMLGSLSLLARWVDSADVVRYNDSHLDQTGE